MFGSGELARTVAQLRRDAGLTQKEMAERANISLAGVRDLEQQRVTRPRVSTLRRLATALELSPTEARELIRFGSQGPVLARDLRLRVLGPLAIAIDGAEISLGSERQRTFLGLLALDPGVPVTIDALVDAGWGIRPPSSAVDLVRSQMSRLRRRIQPRGQLAPVLTARNGGYALHVDDNQLDLLAFRGLVEAARRDRRSGRVDAAVGCYKRAMDLWRGRPLSDVPGLHEQPALTNLRREQETALLEYADSAALAGRHDEVLTPLYEFTSDNPLHEAGHARLMSMLAGSGRRAVALELFETLRRQLSTELGVGPNALVRETHQAILCGEANPERLIPAQRTAPPDTLAPVPAQLPADVYGFTGRVLELEHLDSVLGDERGRGQESPVGVLIGEPGVGKTSLATHWAHRVACRFTDGQLYAELSHADPGEVLRGFLLALGLPPGEVPGDLPRRSARFRGLVTGKRILVLLDNAVSVEQVRPLLPRSPGCVALVTSPDPRTGRLAGDGVPPLTVTPLAERDSLTLLHRRLGPARVLAEPRAAWQIVTRCAGRPAVLAAAADRAATDPRVPLGALAEELPGSQPGRLTGTGSGRHRA